MELNIKVATTNECKVSIMDISKYLSEDFLGISKGKFKYSDTVSIDVLQHNKTDLAIYRDTTITLHNKKEEIDIPVKFDGWFTVHHIVLPSEKWFFREIAKEEGSAIDLYNIVYYSDGVNIYKYIGGDSLQTSIDEVIEINPVNTTISKTDREYVSICFLRKCYINLCLQIFNARGFSPCWNKNKVDSELVYKRDLVWMAINVIKYLTEYELLAEVERLVEVILGCNGLCASTEKIINRSGCGCS